MWKGYVISCHTFPFLSTHSYPCPVSHWKMKIRYAHDVIRKPLTTEVEPAPFPYYTKRWSGSVLCIHPSTSYTFQFCLDVHERWNISFYPHERDGKTKVKFQVCIVPWLTVNRACQTPRLAKLIGAPLSVPRFLSQFSDLHLVNRVALTLSLPSSKTTSYKRDWIRIVR